MEIRKEMFQAIFDAVEARLPFRTPDKRIRDALNAAFAAITLDEATRDRCEESIEGLLVPLNFHSYPEMREGWDQCRKAAVKAIRALPVAPVRPLPTVEDVAKLLCCSFGDGCDFERGPFGFTQCNFESCLREASAVLTLFTGDAK